MDIGTDIDKCKPYAYIGRKIASQIEATEEGGTGLLEGIVVVPISLPSLDLGNLGIGEPLIQNQVRGLLPNSKSRIPKTPENPEAPTQRQLRQYT